MIELTTADKDRLFAEAMRKPFRVEDFIVQSNTPDHDYSTTVLRIFGQ